MGMNEVRIANLTVVSQMIGMCVTDVSGSPKGWTTYQISVLSDQWWTTMYYNICVCQNES